MSFLLLQPWILEVNLEIGWWGGFERLKGLGFGRGSSVVPQAAVLLFGGLLQRLNEFLFVGEMTVADR